MDRETAKQEIRRRWREIIPSMTTPAKRKVNGETSWICPNCRHGEHGDGLTWNPDSKDGNGLKCFGCGWSGDIIDLYQKTTGADFNTALSLLAQEIGITIDEYKPTDTPRPAAADYTKYYKVCVARLSDPDAVAYLESRGISVDTAAAYWIGYDPAADPANEPGAIGEVQKLHPTRRIIIPTSPSHYIARRIDGRSEFAKLNPTGSTPAIFNERVLYAPDVQEVFVTEGAFDALSVIEAGAAAISLNSASNAEALIKKLEQRRPAATLILCLDKDKAGRAAEDTIREGLQRLNISYTIADICGEHKDPNEALTADRQAFIAAVEKARHQAEARPDNTAYYIDALMAGEIERFKNDKTTGFFNLDIQAGGLYSGLYVLAAISSLGKTSLALQLADQIAINGNDVIFFSLEQSRLELVSKSLARRTAQKDNAVNSLSIRKGYMPQQVQEAAQEYKRDIADRLSIVEGNFACNISFIGDYVRQYVRRTGTRPVVFIDYLQILQPAEDTWRKSTKEAVDNTVTELKRLSRELDLTLIIISSVNRANYLAPIDFESLKESGGIEYTADVVWGLQLQCLNDDLFLSEKKIKEKRERVNQAKDENPRKIELRCLKNRYGKASYSCYFDYYPANDLFKESEIAGEYYQPQKAGRRP